MQHKWQFLCLKKGTEAPNTFAMNINIDEMKIMHCKNR